MTDSDTEADTPLHGKPLDTLHVAKQALHYLIPQVVSLAIGFGLTPIKTRYLTPADYGILATAASLASVFAVILDLGQTSAFGRFFFDVRRDPIALRRELSSILVPALLCSTVLAGALTGVIIITAPAILGQHGQLAGTIVTWTIALASPTAFFQALQRVRGSSVGFAVFSISSAGLGAAVTIFVLMVAHGGPIGVLAGALVTAAVTMPVAMWGLRHYISLRVQLRVFRQSLSYGMPLVPHSLAAWITNLADRLILGAYQGLTVVGVYSLGYTIGSLVGLVAIAFNFAWSPFFFGTVADHPKEAPHLAARAATMYVAGITAVALTVGLGTRELVSLLAPAAYAQASKVAPVICLAFWFQAVYYLAANQLLLEKSGSRLLPVATGLAAAVNLSLNFAFVPRFGSMAAAWATAVSFALWLGVAWFLGQRKYHVSYEYGRIGLVIALAVPIVVAGWVLAAIQPALGVDIAAKGLAILAYLLLLSQVGVLPRPHRRKKPLLRG